MSTSNDSTWLRCLLPRPEARMRLLCLPYVGGGPASYREWSPLLGERIEPWTVAPSTALALDALAEHVAMECADWDVPLAIFGHSVGAVTAFEVSRKLIARGRAPLHLFVSGSPPPFTSAPRLRVSDLPEVQFRACLALLGGTAPDILADDEAMAVLGPLLRSEFAFYENHRSVPDARFDVPTTVVGGDTDLAVPVSELVRWFDWLHGPRTVTVVAGGHFYLDSQREALVQRIRATLVA